MPRAPTPRRTGSRASSAVRSRGRALSTRGTTARQTSARRNISSGIPTNYRNRTAKKSMMTPRRWGMLATALGLASGIAAKNWFAHATGYSGDQINHKPVDIGPRNANGNPPLRHMQWNNKLNGIPMPGNNSPSRYTMGHTHNEVRGKLAHSIRKRNALRRAASGKVQRKKGARNIANRTRKRRAATS